MTARDDKNPPTLGGLPRESWWSKFVRILTELRTVLGVLAALIAGLLSARLVLLPPPPPVPEIKIGVIYPGGGRDSKAGKEISAGIEFASQYLNKDGGIQDLHGRKLLDRVKIKPIFANSKSDRCLPYKKVRALAKQGVVAIIGVYESAAALSALEESSRKHIPMLSDTSTAASLTIDDHNQNGYAYKNQRDRPCPGEAHEKDPTPSPWFFRVGPSDLQAATVFRHYLMTTGRVKKIDRIAMIHESHDIYGNDALYVTRKRFPGVLTEDFGYQRNLSGEDDPGDNPAICSPSDKDIRKALEMKRFDHHLDLAHAVKKFHPNVIFAASYTADAVLLMQEMAKARYHHPLVLAYGAGFGDDDFVSHVQKAKCRLKAGDPDNVVTRAAWSSRSGATGAARDVEKLFRTPTRGAMTENSARAFTTVLALVRAIADAAGGDAGPWLSQPVDDRRDQVKEAMDRLCMTEGETIMPWGGIRFEDKDGQSKWRGQNLLASVVLQQRTANDRDGEDGKVVYAEDAGRFAKPAGCPASQIANPPAR
jgi:ABC-type branched-subunit amino acid transport system substrate-binding protein